LIEPAHPNPGLAAPRPPDLGMPLIRFRTYRNADSPALAGLWNRGLPDRGVVRPVSAHEWDAMVVGRVDFDARGLIVAEEGGRVVGFAHAGFGPETEEDPPHRLDRELGTIAMLVVDPDRDSEALRSGLMAEAEAYLRASGAKVLYAGGQGPLNPFYWGLYGGSEFAGILEGHESFRKAAAEAGYRPVAAAELLEADLAAVEARDPMAAVHRRQAKVEVSEDACPSDWWEAVALGSTQITRFRLVSKADDAELARASTWDMAAFGRIDGKARTGLYAVEVAPAHRRKGFGRFLVGEVLRHARGQWGEVVSVLTGATNIPALGLYRACGFHLVDTATLYRRPGH